MMDARLRASASAKQAQQCRPQRSHAVVCKASSSSSSDSTSSRRAMLLGLAAAVGVPALVPRQASAEPFLASSGAKGLLAEEEERLFRMRQELEGEARKQLQAEKEKLEVEARSSQEGKLCATPFGVDIVGITEFIALVGAVVGGVSARQRKAELERLNEQLRTINMSLRQQARAGTLYAPGLSYAPPPKSDGSDGGSANGNGNGSAAPVAAAVPRMPNVLTRPAATPVLPISPAVAASPAAAPKPALVSTTLLSMEEDDMTADQVQCRDALRAGKRLLKEKNGAASMVRFEKALMLSKGLGDKTQERRAQRGLAAAARLTGQHRAAIRHLERVLEISREMREYTGDADAYGTIADCYTDMGEFEKAAMFYDKYIERMSKDGPV